MPAKPAKRTSRTNNKKVYFHIYNKGNENRVIFNDEQDYEVFLGYLKNYLTPAADSESVKKTFKVKGRVYRGVPHQPKNYFNKVELVAYCLMPNHFHLLVHQKTKRSLERFMRSLATRYSKYFNKKYKHTGSVFAGRYKSVQINSESGLCLLTRYFHQVNGYSSYQEYLGERETVWVRTKVVLSSLKAKGESYRNFVNQYKLNQKEKELLEKIVFESEVEHFEKGGSISEWGKLPSEEADLVPDVFLRLRIFELVVAAVVLVLLVGLGIRNIRVSEARTADSMPPSEPSVAQEGLEAEIVKFEEVEPKMVVIKIDDGSTGVNIRQNPTTQSEEIGKAKDGETFEFVSMNSGWYEVKLDDNSTGFVSGQYADTEGASVLKADLEEPAEMLAEGDSDADLEVLGETDLSSGGEGSSLGKMVIIKTEDGSMVNIRQNPTTQSEEIGKAKDGETFEFVSMNSGWYEVKLDDNSTGFVSADYAQIEGENN